MREIFTKQFWLTGGETSQQFRKTASKVDKVMTWIGIAMIPVGIAVLIFLFTHGACALIELLNPSK